MLLLFIVLYYYSDIFILFYLFSGENNESKINTDPIIYLSFEIVKDFLIMTNMTNTLDVLRDECGLREDTLDRGNIINSTSIFIVYCIFPYFINLYNTSSKYV